MKVVTLDPFTLVGLSVRTTNGENAAKDIPALWEEFMGRQVPGLIPNKSSEEVYSMYTNYEGDQSQPYDSVLGCPVSRVDGELAEGLSGFEVAGGKYAVFEYSGNLNENMVFHAWKEIWEMDLDRAYTSDFEVYGAKAQNPEQATVYIYIALKS